MTAAHIEMITLQKRPSFQQVVQTVTASFLFVLSSTEPWANADLQLTAAIGFQGQKGTQSAFQVPELCNQVKIPVSP